MSYSIFSGVTAGLTNAFSVIGHSTTTGVTASTVASAMSNSQLATSLNPTFASYILNNFGTLDTNHDGTLNAAELSNFTNMMNTTGMTQAQLAQLGAASGLSNQTLEQVLQHFNDIDVNHDGKVSSAEIQAYRLKSNEEEKKAEFSNKTATNMSVFYADDSASTTNSSSLLSFKYMNENNGNNNSSNS